MQIIVDLVVPLAVFLFTIVILWLLMRLGLDKIEPWAKTQTWPAITVLYTSARWSAIVFIVLIAAYAGLLAAPWSGGWGHVPPDLLLSLAIIAVMMTVLNILQSMAAFYGQRLNLAGATRGIRATLSVIFIVATILLLLMLWGAQTSPLLIFIEVFLILLVLVLRDTGPDYAAALQLAMWAHLRIGESIKLQNGQQGVVYKLGWHNVELLTPEGHSIIIPNSKFVKEIVTKFNNSPEAVKASVEFFEKQTASALCEIDQPKLCVDIRSILSRREMEIAELVSQGATNKELADKLFISENTVKVHIKNILQKLEIKNRQQLAVLAATQSKKGE
jgi:DNA-binding CsgD family transcriptional regulator/small-conductance mechanosensitive channel